METADILTIQQVISLYGHVVDERRWERFDEIFTHDLVFDAIAIGGAILRGMEDLKAAMDASPQHPLAHHATNIVVSQDESGRVNVVSKGIGIRHDRTVGSVVYRDVLRHEAGKWRIAHRTVERLA